MHHRRAFTLVELLVVIAIVGLLVGLLIPAVQAARESARRTQCSSQLKQIGLALGLYHEAHGVLPPAYLYNGLPLTKKSTGTLIFDSAVFGFKQPNDPGWSWLVLSLPFLEQGPLYDQIDLNTSVLANESIRTLPLPVSSCPSDRLQGIFTVTSETNTSMGFANSTSYAACYGALGLPNTQPEVGNGIFQRNSQCRFSDIRDGVSSTIAVGERAALLARAPWAGVMTQGTVRTTPGAPVYVATVELAPVMAMARVGKKYLNSPYSEPYDFFSAHGERVYFVFVDGSVHGFSSAIDQTVLQAFATRNLGEAMQTEL